MCTVLSDRAPLPTVARQRPNGAYDRRVDDCVHRRWFCPWRTEKRWFRDSGRIEEKHVIRLCAGTTQSASGSDGAVLRFNQSNNDQSHWFHLFSHPIPIQSFIHTTALPPPPLRQTLLPSGTRLLGLRLRYVLAYVCSRRPGTVARPLQVKSKVKGAASVPSYGSQTSPYPARTHTYTRLCNAGYLHQRECRPNVGSVLMLIHGFDAHPGDRACQVRPSTVYVLVQGSHHSKIEAASSGGGGSSTYTTLK